ncbi:penicillin-binding protein 1C [Haliangium ochraceum]|uniref:peptidoglycan glycosyltransferase n=1 Tax=Haliangium ochraceum (strain DSM 14365 / JCM 11303 / SMP-2) TaxID=502025 RepID=D0LGW2_HALO1|nr:transglycosylase domain-containing protein [Haliangium ochraceum]ACY14684.1 Peptidoglycan glycosyltransferase [Haliangium ochraceum DSM 14365]
MSPRPKTGALRARWTRFQARRGKRLAALALVATLAAASYLAVALVWWIAVFAGSFPAELLDKGTATSLVVRDADGALLRQEATGAGGRESWRALDEISPHLVHATLASEDNHFYEHAGVDWSAIARAMWLNLERGRIAFGGSTVTMQLARLTAGTPRTLLGKLRQVVLAARLERARDKREILEQYLNRVYYGNAAWGAEQAARFYFGKGASALSVGEAALLAVIPRGPTYYDPLRHEARAERRRRHILGLMYAHGYLSAAQRELAERTPLQLRTKRPNFRAPHFVEQVKQRLPASLRRGAEVRTTLDASLQTRVENAVVGHLSKIGWKNVTQTAVVVLRNRDGAVLAYVGSRDYDDRAHNGAYDYASARLRPGSTLKPFVYASAIASGDTPATGVYDLILPEDVGEFYTKDVRSHGYARYREALAGSYNLSAVHALQRVGIARVLGKLRAAGLGTLDRADEDYDWGLAIGHAEVRLLDLTAAFTTFGRGGRPVTPRFVEDARAPGGQRWREPVRERAPVFSEEVTYLIYDILSDPDARKPMFGDRVPMNLPFPVALKTGTTKAYTDNWAVGATREFTVGVWAGNFDGSPTHRVMSIEGATPLMRAVYTAIASRYGDPTAIERPSAVVGAPVCALSGKRPGPHCTHHKHELFIAGHLPEETCDWHRLVCGEPAVVYPPVLRPWMAFYDRLEPSNCPPEPASGLQIVSPSEGARYVLEEHRPARYQRPPMVALPNPGDVRWTIEGEPAEAWVPRPGSFTIVAERDGLRDEVRIHYE